MLIFKEFYRSGKEGRASKGTERHPDKVRPRDILFRQLWSTPKKFLNSPQFKKAKLPSKIQITEKT